MAKKTFIALGMTVLLVGFVYSQDGYRPSPISIGVKATFDLSSDGDIQTGPSQIFGGHPHSQRIVEGIASELQGGISIFFDAKYVEFSTNFLIGSDSFQIKRILGVDVNYNPDVSLNISNGFSLLGKFPFKFQRLTLSPSLGVEYRFMIIRVSSDYLDEAETIPNDFQSVYNSFILKFGGIVDFDLTERIFLRGNILGSYVAAMFTDGNPYKEGGGVQVQIGIGYRL